VSELHSLLELAKSAGAQAGLRLLDALGADEKSYVYSHEHPREIKAVADTALERDILHTLAPTGLPVLSEEAGYLPSERGGQHWWIVDPLDGTFNFIKGLGPSAVSIALWKGERPIFGVVFDLMERRLFLGGPGIGAYADGRRISVSATSTLAQASICTGFPTRFDVEDISALQSFSRTIKPFAKVRMIGCAAVSLLHVARGSADVYAEQKIMLWDVAAGLAIVEGAGGGSVLTKTHMDWCYDTFASNACLLPSFHCED
jgi:myo-inositol-1(or 4)-monophosphatase